MNKKDRQRIKLTEKSEKAYAKALEKEYSEAYKASKAEIASFIAKYGTDDEMSNDMFARGRFDRLVKAIEASVATIKKSNPQEINSYLKDQYMLNYYHSAFTLETTAQRKLGFKALSRKKLDPLSITGKISLQQNKQIVRANIRKAVTQSIAQGEGIGSTAKRVKMALERNMNDAMRIAVTETTTLSNEAIARSQEQASKVLKVQKMWVSTLDGTTRDRHRKIDGETVDIDKKFSNGLMHPGDQSAGKPEEVINCRCTMITIVDDDQPTMRRARTAEGSEVIPYTTYEEWAKNRL